MIRLLAIDIDGTLLDSRGRIPGAHRAALVEADRQGLRIALVTGRSHHFTTGIVDALALPVTVIVNNGAVVKAPDGSTVLRHVLSRQTALHVLERTTAYEDSVALIFDRFPGPDERKQIVCDRMDWSHPARCGYYEKNRAFIASVSPLSHALTEDPIQVMFNGSVRRMRELAAALSRTGRGKSYEVSVTEYEYRDFSLVDVNGPGCTKGSTLARWCASIGVDAAEVMAVGDNLNDLGMLTFAGTAVVMGNAVPALRRCGFHETSSHDEGGLAEAIRRFALKAGIG